MTIAASTPSDPDPLVPLTHAIRRHAAFDAAALAYFDRVLTWRRRLGRFNRVGTNLGFHIINYAVYLHFASRAGAIEHGATFSRMLEICQARGQCGGRALRSVLLGLQVLGHLHARRSPDDGRVQIYLPSDKLILEVREIYGYSMEVLDAMLPGADRARAIETDETFIAKLLSASGRAIIEDGVKITEAFPDLHDLISQAGGLPTTLSLARAQAHGQEFPSHQAIARDFKISASQVRAVVGGAADRGLVERADNGRILGAQPLVDQHKNLLARELALHVRHGLALEDRLLGSDI